LIAAAISTQLTLLLKTSNQKCKVIGSDQLIYIPSANRSLYADVIVFCDKPLFHDDNQWLLVNPLLIAEVLSKSTQSYYKGEKFDLYRTLPSFQEYMLVAQDKPSVQARFLQDPANDFWKYSNAEGLDASIQLRSIGVTLELKDIYAVIEEFTEEAD
jgi:Uma2 family endonuclease